VGGVRAGLAKYVFGADGACSWWLASADTGEVCEGRGTWRRTASSLVVVFAELRSKQCGGGWVAEAAHVREIALAVFAQLYEPAAAR
jgi:hypothetical protein